MLIDKTRLKDLLDKKSNITIAQEIGAKPEEYQLDKIELLNFSQRVYNVAKRHQIDTLSDILSLTFYELGSLKGAGKNSVEELLEKTIDYVYNPDGKTRQLQVFNMELIDCLNSYQQGLKNSNKLIEIGNSLLRLLPNEYSDKYEGDWEELKQCFNLQSDDSLVFPDIINEKYAFPFAKAYSIVSSNKIIEETIQPEDKIYELGKYVNINKDKIYTWNLRSFFKWISMDVRHEMKCALSLAKEEREDDIVNRIINGDTLEIIGNDYSLTRERVRQIKVRYFEKVVKYLNSKSIILWLFAYSNEKGIIRQSLLKELLGDENAFTYWYIVKHKFFDIPQLCSYSLKYDALTLDTLEVNYLSQAEEIVMTFPDEVLCDEMDQLIIDASLKNGCQNSYLLDEVNRQFNFYYEFYSRNKYNLREMCSYILKNKFPFGYRSSEREDFETFCNYLSKLINYDISSVNQHSLNARIVESAFMCDRGVYKHTDYLNESGNSYILHEYINNQFENGRTALSFNEIFENTKEKIPGEFDNPFMLHGLISNMQLPYSITRDYVLKEPDSSFENDVIDFVKKCYPVSIDKVARHFCSNETQMTQMVDRSNKLDRKGGLLFYKRK